MPRIRCRYIGCVHLDSGLCSAPVVDLDPEEGCHTFLQSGDPYDDETWEDEDSEYNGYEEWDDDDDDFDYEIDDDY
jgi:hypothetical protein